MILTGTSGASTLDAGSQAAADAAKLNEDLNRFLNLLITQLKNQDPLDLLTAEQ